jgi:hypothetical protein
VAHHEGGSKETYKEVARMTTVMTSIKKWQDDYMTLMARLEEPVVRYTSRASESVAPYVPQRPQWAFLDRVPSMTELVDSQLKFRRRVVDEQAAFIRTLMKSVQPALTKLEPKAAPHQDAMKRASVKRATAKQPAVRRVRAKAA